jgi:hypothetical protein
MGFGPIRRRRTISALPPSGTRLAVGSTIAQRIRISRFGDANGRCSGFEPRRRYRSSAQFTPWCTTISIRSAISSRGKSTSRDALLPWPSGALSRHAFGGNRGAQLATASPAARQNPSSTTWPRCRLPTADRGSWKMRVSPRRWSTPIPTNQRNKKIELQPLHQLPLRADRRERLHEPRAQTASPAGSTAVPAANPAPKNRRRGAARASLAIMPIMPSR